MLLTMSNTCTKTFPNIYELYFRHLTTLFPFLLPLQAEDLRKPNMHLKGLLKANLVYATKFLDSQRLFSKVSLQDDGRILLHGLTEDTPPEGACILQVRPLEYVRVFSQVTQYLA